MVYSLRQNKAARQTPSPPTSLRSNLVLRQVYDLDARVARAMVTLTALVLGGNGHIVIARIVVVVVNDLSMCTLFLLELGLDCRFCRLQSTKQLTHLLGIEIVWVPFLEWDWCWIARDDAFDLEISYYVSANSDNSSD